MYPVIGTCDYSCSTILEYLKFVSEVVTDVIPYNAAVIEIWFNNWLVNTNQIESRNKWLYLF